MSYDVYMGTIMPFAFGFVPRGWLKCDGTIYSIQENTALYALLGNTYGGEFDKSFAVPDLRGRVLLNYGGGPGLTNWNIGQYMGSEKVKLDLDHLPPHSHGNQIEHMEATIKCCSNSENMTDNPAGNSISAYSGVKQFSDVTPHKILNWETIELQEGIKIGYSGGSEGHDNIQPGLVLNYCICFDGIYPSRD